jgi:hypothetical protein
MTKKMFDIEPFVHKEFGFVWAYGNPQSDYRVRCPFCIERYGSPDTKGKLHISINPERPFVHCFRCGYSSNWFGMVRSMTGGDHISVMGELYVSPSVSDFHSVEERFKKSEGLIVAKKVEVQLPDDFIPLSSTNVLPLIGRARKYMRSRGFDENYWKKHNIGVAPSQGLRVIIPIEDNYWQGRRLIDWLEPKYTNPKAESAGVIFNPSALSYNEVVICEGVFSALAVGDNALAILRKDATIYQVRRFLESPANTFIIALEPEAFSSMKKLADKLVAGNKEVVLWKYVDGDPAEFSEPPEVIKYNLKNKLRILLSE